MRKMVKLVCTLTLVVLAVPAQLSAAKIDTATPAPLVDSYESLADAILATKKTEWNLVHSILAGTYKHAEGIYKMARGKIEAGQDARQELEALADLVSQLGNEGDAKVAAVRKRLLEGGHHHHADGEEKGIYDEGFVIVTRAAKKALLESGKNIGKMARTPDVAALDAEWAKVEQQFKALH